MLVKYKRPGTKRLTYKRKTYEIPSTSWFECTNLDVYLNFKKYPAVFECVHFIDVKALARLSEHLRFERNLIFVSHPPAIRKLAKTKHITLQATTDKGESIFRINNYDGSDMSRYNGVEDVSAFIFRELGGLGDVIMTLPVIERIKRSYPNYSIHYAVPKEFIELAENNPFVSNAEALSTKVTQRAYDVIVNLTTDCIKYEIENQPAVKKNRVEVFLDKCGFEGEEIPRPKLYLTENEILRGQEEVNGVGPHIGIVLGSNAPVRNWPKFYDLRDQIFDKYPNAQLYDIAQTRPEGYIGDNNLHIHQIFDRSLREVAGIMSRLDLVVGPDTGPMHMASALSVPTVWLFTHIDGRVRTKNYDHVSIVQKYPEGCPSKGVKCWYDIPCGNRAERTKSPECSTAITVEDVMGEINPILSRPYTSWIVVCYNGWEITEECLKRVRKEAKRNDEILIVDNGSTDETWGKLRRLNQMDSRITVIHNKGNEGCIIARNQAMKAARGTYVLTLDNDQFISPSTFHRLVSVEADVVGTESWRMDKDGWAFETKNPSELAYVGAGGMLVKRKNAEKLGYFSEEYAPAWFEDPDFCFKARRAGMSIGFHPNPGIEHLSHQTVNNQKTFDSNEVWKRNHEYFVKTWKNVLNPPPEISVVILSLNRSALTIRCVETLIAGARGVPVEVIVLDQGSNEENIEILRKAEFKNVKIIEGKINRMVSAGRNYGTKFATAPVLFFADDDMIFPDQWASKILKRFEETDFVAISPNVAERRPGQNLYLRYHAGFIGKRGFEDPAHRMSPYCDIAQKEREVDILPGGSFVVRKEVFDEIPFDEKFVYGVEDYDWCLTAREKGYRMGNCPSVLMIHDRQDFKRQIVAPMAKRREETGTTYVIDSVRLLIVRWRHLIPWAWDDNEFWPLALTELGKAIPVYKEKEEFIYNEVKKRFPDEEVKNV